MSLGSKYDPMCKLSSYTFFVFAEFLQQIKNNQTPKRCGVLDIALTIQHSVVFKLPYNVELPLTTITSISL